MALSQRVIFTVIPDGFEGDWARLNLHIAPRLSIDAADQPNLLQRFPAWIDWAATINAADIDVRVNGGQVRSERLEAARQDVWSALFPGETRVQTHAFEDLRGHDVLSYPMAELAAAIEADYVRLAGEEGDQLPVAEKLAKVLDYRPARELSRDGAVRLLRETNSAEAVSRRSVAVALLAAYHQPLGKQKLKVAEPDRDDDGRLAAEYVGQDRVDMPSIAALAEKFDFHRIAAAVGQHPMLMRACGLVVPLRIRLSDLPQGDLTVQVTVDWNTGGTNTEADICPRTQARLTAQDFRARPRDPGFLRGGWLRMEPSRFHLVAMDVDGAGLSLKNMAINLPNAREERFDDERFDQDRQARTGTPRIRTAGIQLAQTRRDRAIRSMFESSGALNDAAMAAGTTDLFAEDLIRGWRADIIDDRSSRWQSLLRFDGSYELVNAGQMLATEDEESVLKIAAGKAADGSDPKLFKASEALFAWSGWSLAAPQPSLAIMPDDTSHSEAPNTTPDGLPLKVTPRAHRGSLPLLRFGRRYRTRLRYADLAGGGVTWQLADAGVPGVESAEYLFGRYEPVEPPTLTLIEGDPLPKDGESMGRAALRTMDDAAANDISARRNVVPPRVGVRFAELHGVVDRGNRPDPAVYKTLVDRDADYPEQPVPGMAFDPADPAGKAYDTKFAKGPEAALTPYLYDPLAAGAALRIAGVPGINPDKVWSVPFVGDVWDPNAALRWPDARGFSLCASETEPTGWNAARRTFTVKLAPGERARVRISALVPKRGLKLFKLLERLEAAAASGSATAVKRFNRARGAIARGQHWMFTPWRTVELVHAVQRPLVTPAYLSLGASRSPDEVAAQIFYATPIHCKSTVRIDTDAHWIEINDQGADGPVVRSLDTDAFSRPFARLDAPEGVAWRLFDKHVFTDTRARYVGYRMRATTRFREFMPPAIRKDPDLIDRKGERRAIWVPASSPPAAPIVRYVVPTFGWWESGGNDGTRRVWREGGGLRVYLDRPWFSSGSNEMLAVLLPMVADVPKNGPLRDFVSQWGADPVWAGPKVRTVAPRRTDLPRRIDKGPVPYDFGDPDTSPNIPDGNAAGNAFPLTNLRPQGAPDDIRVEAVPHAVGYDPERKLWYCDIIVRPGEAYFPFIRLALARYQPHAISGCELSSVALASFQQLSQDRVAVVTPAGGFLGRGRRVSVYGRLPSEGFTHPSAGNIQVRLQRLKPGGDPDLDWQDTPQGQPPQPMPAFDIGVRQVSRSRSGFEIPRTSLVAEQRELLRAGERVSAGSLAGQIDKIPGVFELLLPPLMHEEHILLPAHDDDRLRLLITETETYRTEDEKGHTMPVAAERIVYAAAVEL
jgi:hypothetical protein